MKKSDINILIVDDEEGIRDLLRDAVKRWGYKPTVVGKPEEALNIAKIKALHFAIIDCVLPKINGVKLVEELRHTQFADAPVVLISGIFKDKSFISDAIRKSNAIQFLTKPFEVNELKSLIESSLKEEIGFSGVPLHALVSKNHTSPRERRRAIESIEEISGYDLPFVLALLMDSKTSGHINIVNDSEEIYGITLREGKVIKVDTSDQTATHGLLLIQHGFLSSQELSELGKGGKKGDLLKNLINSNLVSPHVVPIIKTEQTLMDLRRLFGRSRMKFNFVPDEVTETGAHVDIEKLTPLIHEAIENIVSLDYLDEFYAEWKEYPIQLGPQFSKSHPVFSLELCTKVSGIQELLAANSSINEILETEKFKKEDVLKALHILALRNIILFGDAKKIQRLHDQVDRIRGMLNAIKGKNPMQVFQYFGASDPPKQIEVERIYKEYAKANHPDTLPPTAKTEVKRIFNEMFSIISEAHDVLTNEEKRNKFVVQMQKENAERQIKAEALSEDAEIKLQRGKIKEALDMLEKANQIHSAKSIKLNLAWAKIRNSRPPLSADLSVEVEALLESIPHPERREAKYQFVRGLLARAQGDFSQALQCYERALQHDPDFLEARRGMASLPKKKKANASGDGLLTADLGELLGSLFKKKG